MDLRMTTNAPEYGAAMIRFANGTGRVFSEVLAHEAEQQNFPSALYREFRKARPHERISEVAAGLFKGGQGLRRIQGSTLAPVANGLSLSALQKASDILGGAKSDLFQFRGRGGLQIAKLSLKAGKAGEKRGPGFLTGKSKTGWIGPNKGLRSFKVTPDQLTAAMNRQFGRVKDRTAEDWKTAPDRPRRLNLRALANYYEIRFRQSAALGGVMGIQWLSSTYVSAGASLNRFGSTKTEKRGNRSVPLGSIEFKGGQHGLESFTLTGYVPGTARVDARAGCVAKAIAYRAADLSTALSNHWKKHKADSRFG